jgi:hypothetical protein
MQQKAKKEQDRLEKVHRNLKKNEKERREKLKKSRLLESNCSSTSSHEEDSFEVRKAKAKLRFENVHANKERFKRQEDYKKYKILIKHAQGLTDRLRKKVNDEIKAQNSIYLTNIGNHDIETSQMKVDSLIKKAKINSKSMKELIEKSHLKEQVKQKKHLQEDEEEEEHL